MNQNFRIAIIAVVPILVIIAFLFKDEILELRFMLTPCMVYETTGIYCTGCGNTRSIICLMKGDIIGSVRNNIAPPLIAFLLLCLYIEFIFATLEKPVKILPRKGLFWGLVIGAVFVIYILRNFIPQLAPL